MKKFVRYILYPRFCWVEVLVMFIIANGVIFFLDHVA